MSDRSSGQTTAVEPCTRSPAPLGSVGGGGGGHPAPDHALSGRLFGADHALSTVRVVVKWLLAAAARQVSFISLPSYTALRQRCGQLTALCGQIGGVGIVSAITEMPPGDTPPRRTRAPV